MGNYEGTEPEQARVKERDCMNKLIQDYEIAIKVLEAQNKHLESKIRQLEAQSGTDTNVPRWISVEDEMPKDDVEVLVYAIGDKDSSVIAMTSYTHRMYGYNIEGWRSPWQYFFDYKITHWMPLPEPPKEG